MEQSNERKTVTLSVETWKGLTKIKYERLFDTLDDVITYLLSLEGKK